MKTKAMSSGWIVRSAAVLSGLLALAIARKAEAQQPPYPPWPGYQPLPQVPVPRRLRFETDKEATLEVLWPDPSGGADWKPVCVSPCDAQAWAGLKYRIGGPGVKRSEPFTVYPGQDPLTVQANVGSKGQWLTGVIVTPIGGVTLFYGVLLYALEGFCFDSCGSQSDDTNVAAAVLMASGAAAVAVGIVLITSNQTQVSSYDLAPRGVPLGAGFSLGPQGLMF